jgi:putative FmdB family regulatory protein
MPIYEYECEKCGAIEEVFQKFSDSPLETCPKCSGKLHKLMSQSSFHLKGTGWYVTDYANKSVKKAESSLTPKDKKNDNSTGSSDTGTQTTKSSSSE